MSSDPLKAADRSESDLNARKMTHDVRDDDENEEIDEQLQSPMRKRDKKSGSPQLADKNWNKRKTSGSIINASKEVLPDAQQINIRTVDNSNPPPRVSRIQAGRKSLDSLAMLSAPGK